MATGNPSANEVDVPPLQRFDHQFIEGVNIMRRRTIIPTHRGFARTYWHLLAWIGWTCLVLGVSAMSLQDQDSLRSLTTAALSWPVGPADKEVAQRYGQTDGSQMMPSPAPAEPNPGPTAIGNYD
jgi:hypothetical protein